VGGGSDPRPGEISLAHQGVLFLDELPEFRRDALEVLREPLETGTVTLSRASRQAQYPARFQLLAAMNPCPCGYLGDPERACRCTPDQIQRYHARISGPLLDRIDLQIEMPRIPWEQLQSGAAEASAAVRKRVLAARAHQQARGYLNAQLPLDRLESLCALGAAEQLLLRAASTKFRLSPRSIHRILRIARTIADLDHAERIRSAHLQEAITYRCLDRQTALGH
jgi:magnesium chelatase family protein